jgi:methyl acetate hydrolase
MNHNHTGTIAAGIMKTTNPARSNDVDLFPGAPLRWGLGYMLNREPGPNGRSAGTVQILPFADTRPLKLYGQYEKSVYDALKMA